MTQTLIAIYIALAAVFGVIFVVETESDLHGSLAVDFGTDSNQFAQWQETHDG